MLSRVLKPLTAAPLERGGRRRPPRAVLAGVTAVGLLVLALLAYGRGDTKAMAGSTAWSAAGTDQPVVRSAWLTIDTLVYLDHEAGMFVALAKRDGARLWEYRVPAAVWNQDRRICAVSGIYRDAVAVSYHADGSGRGGCSTLMVFDIAAGKPRWSRDQGAEEHFLGAEFGAGLLVATDGAQQIRAFDAAGGAARWSGDSNCATHDVVADDRRVVTAADCGSGQEVRMLDPATGAPRSRFAVRGRGDVWLASAEPLVVYRLGPPSQVWALSADGRAPTAEFTVNDRLAGSITVGGGRLVLNTRDRGLVAWDLRTGAELWDKGGARRGLLGNKGEIGHPRVVKLDATELVLTRTTTTAGRRGGTETTVVRVDPGTGAATELSPGMLGSQAPARHMFWDSGRLYGVRSDREPGHAAFAID